MVSLIRYGAASKLCLYNLLAAAARVLNLQRKPDQVLPHSTPVPEQDSKDSSGKCKGQRSRAAIAALVLLGLLGISATAGIIVIVTQQIEGVPMTAQNTDAPVTPSTDTSLLAVSSAVPVIPIAVEKKAEPWLAPAQVAMPVTPSTVPATRLAPPPAVPNAVPLQAIAPHAPTPTAAPRDQPPPWLHTAAAAAAPLLIALPPAPRSEVVEPLSLARGNVLILLHESEPGHGAAAWAGLGDAVPTLGREATGLVFRKPDAQACSKQCTFTRDQSKLAFASAVIVELEGQAVAHGLSTLPFQLTNPASEEAPLLGSFFYPQDRVLEERIDESTVARLKFDFSVGVNLKTDDVHVGKVCLWGTPLENLFKLPSTFKTRQQRSFKDQRRVVHFAADVAYPQDLWKYVKGLYRELAVHIYDSTHNVDYPTDLGNEYSLQRHLKMLSEYMFVLVIDNEPAETWNGPPPEWSMAFVAGVVPVYIGQHNIVAYAPGPNSYLDARYFDGFEQLGDALKATYRTPSAYMAYHAWRSTGTLAPGFGFEAALGQCVFEAECRVCEAVHKKLATRA